MAWDQAFFDPIILPDGRKLLTLRDAAEFITELPKADHDAAEWQAATEALLLVAGQNGPEMFARIGMMQALCTGSDPRRYQRRDGSGRRLTGSFNERWICRLVHNL